MKKVKQVFPSRNYITIDTQGDIEIVFNPVGDGTEGDDKLTFRRGRWAFRCNDFLAGKMLPNGENESMNRKIYSLNVVYDDENGEPIIDTTYVDPTSVIPLDGSLVTVGNLGTLATVAKQNEIKSTIQGIDLSSLATVAKQNEIKSTIQGIDLSSLATVAKQNEIKTTIQTIHENGKSEFWVGRVGNLQKNEISLLENGNYNLQIENGLYYLFGNLSFSASSGKSYYCNGARFSLVVKDGIIEQLTVLSARIFIINDNNALTFFENPASLNYLVWYHDNNGAHSLESALLKKDTSNLGYSIYNILSSANKITFVPYLSE